MNAFKFYLREADEIKILTDRGYTVVGLGKFIKHNLGFKQTQKEIMNSYNVGRSFFRTKVCYKDFQGEEKLKEAVLNYLKNSHADNSANFYRYRYFAPQNFGEEFLVSFMAAKIIFGNLDEFYSIKVQFPQINFNYVK